MSFSLAGLSTDPGGYEAGKRSSPDRGDSPYRDNAGRDGIAAAPDVHGRALADRVLSELAGQRDGLILVIGASRPRTS
jgi:hypothetical protein